MTERSLPRAPFPTVSALPPTATMPAQESGEIRSLTGLRALLAWWVVAFHFTRHLVPESWSPLRAVVAHGYLAVDVFFVLSGYVLMRGYGGAAFHSRETWRFYRRHAEPTGRPLTLDDQVMGSWYLNFFPLQRLPEFVAGAAAARLNAKPKFAEWIATVTLLAIVEEPLRHRFTRRG